MANPAISILHSTFTSFPLNGSFSNLPNRQGEEGYPSGFEAFLKKEEGDEVLGFGHEPRK